MKLEKILPAGVRSHPQTALVLLWVVLGLSLRLAFLTFKPIWMDEVATVVFSLGNSSHVLSLGQLMSLNQLMEPLTPNPEATVRSAIHYLLQEDNHPPAYFALAHLWMDLFPPVQGVASLWASRALPAILGALAIPFVYLAGRFSFCSPLAGQVGAALMAVSPFGIALSQEARHYGMATLLVAASLACYAAGVKALQEHRAPALWLCLSWIGVNALGIATHYFICLTLLAEALVLGVLAWQQARQTLSILWTTAWIRMYGVILGSSVGGLVWLPVFLNFKGSAQTSSLAIDFSQPIAWINPVAQALAGLIFMVLTPATVSSNWVSWVAIVLTAPLMVFVLLWSIPLLRRGIKALQQTSDGRLGLLSTGGFVLAALFLFFAVSYGAAVDITRGHRYNFVYHAGVIVALGGILAAFWPQRLPSDPLSAGFPFSKQRISGQQVVQLLWSASLISALCVVTNLSFPKYYNASELIRWMQAQSSYPVVLGFPTLLSEKPTVIGHELMSVGWEITRHFNPNTPNSGWAVPPRFFVLPFGRVEVPVDVQLDQLLTDLDRPADLWMLNFFEDLSRQNCEKVEDAGKGGHRFTHYQCQTK
ncbi:MAG TPA: phospholipid carrier-dependent glycosyltransferase [Leptolyngbyaceae cyanobacterium]